MDDEQIRAVAVGEVPTYQEIVLVEYDPQWPALFEQAAEQIRGPSVTQRWRSTTSARPRCRG
jgi:GrpB-like predicted nucleotidyltransferase (UPF0157 family)